MKNTSRFVVMEEFIVRDEKLVSTIISFIMILTIFVNLNLNLSPAVGTIASIVYFMINGAFLGRTFFEKEKPFLRFMLGNLLLVTCLALIAWAVMVVYNLDITRSALVLCIVAALTSLLNKRDRLKNALQ